VVWLLAPLKNATCNSIEAHTEVLKAINTSAVQERMSGLGVAAHGSSQKESPYSQRAVGENERGNQMSGQKPED